jgi:hypothetical protein
MPKKPTCETDAGFAEFVATHLQPIDNKEEYRENVEIVRQRARDYYFQLTGKEIA